MERGCERGSLASGNRRITTIVSRQREEGGEEVEETEEEKQTQRTSNSSPAMHAKKRRARMGPYEKVRGGWLLYGQPTRSCGCCGFSCAVHDSLDPFFSKRIDSFLAQFACPESCSNIFCPLPSSSLLRFNIWKRPSLRAFRKCLTKKKRLREK